MGSFVDDTTVTMVDGRLTATLSRDWDIWGPNGGYIASIVLRAVGKIAPPDHKPATFSCQYLAAGQFDAVDIAIEPVRQGRNAWCLNAVLTQGGKRVLQAQVWTTNKTDGPEKTDRKMPEVPSARAQIVERTSPRRGGASFLEAFRVQAGEAHHLGHL